MPMLSDREFVNMRIMRRDFPNKGDITYFFKSVRHPKAQETKDCVRGWFEFSYATFRRLSPRTTEVFMFSAADMKVNFFFRTKTF